MGHGGPIVSTTVMDDAPSDEIVVELRRVTDRAIRGDATAVARLRQILDDYPAIWEYYGDLARHARLAWISLAAGNDLHLRESLARKAAALEAELAGAVATPLERLLAQRVVAGWLRTNYFEGT